MDADHPLAIEFKKAVEAADGTALRQLFEDHPEVIEVIDHPWFSFGTPALVQLTRSDHRDAITALLDAGANVDAKSDWAAGPYSALDVIVDSRTVNDALADYLIGHGATLDLHAASGLGRMDRLRELLEAAPHRINEAGPDGATALHLARSVEVAAYLLDRGADIEQRCVDHRSTPIMWSTQGREDVTRYLAEQGARTDLFIAAVLNDVEMAARVLEHEPEALGVRVRHGNSHAHLGFGDKYVWTLDSADTPIEVARRRGHDEVFEFLLGRSSGATRLLMAARSGDLTEMAALLASSPELVPTLSEPETCSILCGSGEVIALMLRAGADPNARDDEHGATPLHHAAWNHDRSRVDVLLQHGADATLRDRTYEGTPADWARHGGHHDLAEILLNYEA